ncbi:alkylhydroperoxidase/carboxymuconolactone decarboxylase family protein YurZ [Sphingobium xenophagum]|uniref:Alkylhydroperoxidase/carboxymuconolactone decarboxylase family protein YurZ n=1 Tax=Sphingobium xenophagum TaxID=121428 RepID=A0ABU1X582_SPHXE|nr:carboxymuconolactone decarboxylase family protein [Sphingobium xenophagum]MDR7156739.1 alkylhydroperoxidase/carboxymuconolactone decarboxylase family protein YurZ [Sphingobium xenophagum]
MTKSPLMDVALLRGHAPYTLAGYEKFRAVVESDGAVPARLKALFAAVAAIDRRHLALARRELERGVALGLTLKEATAGLIVLTSLRGEAAALDFAQVVADCYNDMDVPVPQPLPTALEGEAEANFRAYWAGEIPSPLGVLMRLVPEGADAYYLMRRGSIDANPLSAKYGELLLLAILAAGYSPMAATHVRGARNAGASDQEIAEAVLCAVPSAGIAAWMAVGGMLAPPEEGGMAR